MDSLPSSPTLSTTTCRTSPEQNGNASNNNGTINTDMIEKRAEMNRLAQKAFRARKKEKMKDLERQVTELSKLCNLKVVQRSSSSATLNGTRKTITTTCLDCGIEQAKADAAIERVKMLEESLAISQQQIMHLQALLNQRQPQNRHSENPQSNSFSTMIPSSSSASILAPETHSLLVPVNQNQLNNYAQAQAPPVPEPSNHVHQQQLHQFMFRSAQSQSPFITTPTPSPNQPSNLVTSVNLDYQYLYNFSNPLSNNQSAQLPLAGYIVDSLYRTPANAIEQRDAINKIE
ncbi:hypothetical protein BDR26DRAFT_930577 [Obelidium mucronatum]|nr:hypothetical protein BDR26DRAFT_930577 [Obelidium mucronatum]